MLGSNFAQFCIFSLRLDMCTFKPLSFMSSVNSWCKSRRLKHLGVPMFLGSGSFDHSSTRLRFLVMERFGKDVDELFISSGRRFDITTVFTLGLRVVSTIFTTIIRNPMMALNLLVALI